MARRMVAVLGAGECDEHVASVARTVGHAVARRNVTLVTGGLGGVMAAAAEGARRAGGLVVGILPGDRPELASPHVDIAIATGIGDARNALIANTAAGFVAIGGGPGTLSEIAFALKRDKPVVSVGSWDVDPRVEQVPDPQTAVDRLFEHLEGPRGGLGY